MRGISMRSRLFTAAVLAILCLAALPLASQNAGAAFPFTAKDSMFGPEARLSDYVRENLAGFSTFTLSNGIPVIVKFNNANRVQHLSLVIRGGSLLADPAKAGLESISLGTMERGSTKYSYSAIQNLLDETSSSISHSSSFDFSSYSLNTLDKYFARTFPVWADTLTSPAFLEVDFAQVLSDAALALKSKEQNPWSKTGLVINTEFLAGHPYATTPEGTKESLAAMNLKAVKEWYASMFSAGRMFVVAVGNFDASALRRDLEATIGAIPARGDAASAALLPATPPLRGPVESRLVKSVYPQSKGIGYIRGDFAAPGPEDPDYMAANVAMKILSDLLFNVMRDKYGATYSPAAYIRGFMANYGSLVIYKTKVAAQAKSYLDEAVAEMAAGLCVSVDPTSSGGAEPRMTIAEALPTYKALFINSYYEGQQTNASVAARIAGSVIGSGDYRSYLLDTDRVLAVTADEVVQAFRRYLLGGKILWVVLGSADVTGPVGAADYAGFGK